MSVLNAVYIDTSVVLAKLLKEPGGDVSWQKWDPVITSEVFNLEVSRALDRLRLLGRYSEGSLGELTRLFETTKAGLYEIPLTKQVLARASARFPTIISSLDAIHLTSALLWKEATGAMLTFMTNDDQQRKAAAACGLPVTV